MTKEYSHPATPEPKVEMPAEQRKRKVKMITIPLEQPAAWPEMTDYLKKTCFQLEQLAQRAELSDDEKRLLAEGRRGFSLTKD